MRKNSYIHTHTYIYIIYLILFFFFFFSMFYTFSFSPMFLLASFHFNSSYFWHLLFLTFKKKYLIVSFFILIFKRTKICLHFYGQKLKTSAYVVAGWVGLTLFLLCLTQLIGPRLGETAKRTNEKLSLCIFIFLL